MQYLMGLGELALRALLLGAMGTVAASIARRRGAEVQHAIWSVVLAGMLALPLLTAALPPLRALSAPIVPTVFQPPAAVTAPSKSGHAAIVTAPIISTPRHRDFNWPAVAFAVYCSGVVFLLLRTGVAVRRTARIVDASVRVRDAEMGALFADAAAALAMGYPLPELRESGSVSVPFTAGWSEPAIVLPAEWRTWDQFKLRSVLSHELAHVRRRDWATSVAAAIDLALFWCHPLAWWLERKLAALAEEACDAAAIGSTSDEQRYASVLLEFAMTGATSRAWAATAMAQPSRVGFRIKRILEGRVVHGRGLTHLTWTAILAVALPLVYSASALQLTSDQATASPASAQQDNATYGTILADGWQLTPDTAARIESDLVSHPHNIAARTRLISYYYQRMIAEPRTRHVLWLIENHPEANVFRVASAVTDMTFPNYSGLNTQPGYERARELWLQHTKRRPNDPAILVNAINALSDAEVKLQLLRQGRAVEPRNPAWTTWLATVYTRAVRDVFFAQEPGSGVRRFMGPGGPPAAGHVFRTPLPMAQNLKAELETSTDAALVGATGELLVGETAMLTRSGTITPEVVAAAAFGKRLLERASTLEPGNPRWHQN